MHSFENGMSIAVKKANWKLLMKFFEKRGVAPGGFPLTQAEADEIMACKPETILNFINRVYEFLSGKRLPVISAAPPLPDVGSTMRKLSQSRILDKPVPRSVSNSNMLSNAGFQGSQVDPLYQEPSDDVKYRDRYSIDANDRSFKANDIDSPGNNGGISNPEAANAYSLGAGAGVSAAVRLRAVGGRDSTGTNSKPPSTADMDSVSGGANSVPGPVHPPPSSASYHHSNQGAPPYPHRPSANVLEELNKIVLETLSSHIGGGEALRRLNPTLPTAFAFRDAVLAAMQANKDKDMKMQSVDEKQDEDSDAHIFGRVFASVVLQALQRNAAHIANACLITPRGFMHVMNMLCPLLEATTDAHNNLSELDTDSADDHGSTQSNRVPIPVLATETFILIIRRILILEPGTADHSGVSSSERTVIASSLCESYFLPFVVPILKRRPASRLSFLRALFAFVEPADVNTEASISDIRVTGLTLLLKELQHIPTFISCLAVTATLDIGRQLDDSLADLYVYYALVGIVSPVPTVRAAGLSILASIVNCPPTGASLIMGLLSKLVPLKDDNWWQVQLSLISITSDLLWYLKEELPMLQHRENTPATNAINEAIGLLIRLFSSNEDPGPLVHKFLVAHVAKLLPYYANHIGVFFVRAVAHLSMSDRTSLLAVTPQGALIQAQPITMNLLHSSGQYVTIPSIGRHLYPPGPILKSIIRGVREDELQHLEVGHFQLILACIASADEMESNQELEMREDPPLSHDFVELANNLRDHIFVGLCDPNCCHVALCVLRHFILRMDRSTGAGPCMLETSTMLGSLMLLHAPPSGTPHVDLQHLVADFLLEIAAYGGHAVSSAVSHLIYSWASKYPSLHQESPLKRVAEELSNQRFVN